MVTVRKDFWAIASILREAAERKAINEEALDFIANRTASWFETNSKNKFCRQAFLNSCGIKHGKSRTTKNRKTVDG